MNKSIERQINKIYNEVYKKVFNRNNTTMLANGSRLPAQQALVLLQSSEKYDKFAQEFAKELAKQGMRGKKGLWRKYYETARKAHYVGLPATFTEFEYQTFSNAVRHNFNMIKSVPTRMMEILNHKYTSTLIEEVAKGNLSRGSFKKMLEKHGHKQAGVIARTETAKLQTAITRTRAENVGSVAYTWISSKDKRTRPSHRMMDKVIVFWRPDAEKPLLDNMRGDAGEFPNCRCDAQPIVDIDEITQSRYKVYDYTKEQIVSMSKKEVIDAINKGGLHLA